MILPTHSHWPLTPGSQITYTVFNIEGVYKPSTMELSITKQTDATVNGRQIMRVVRLPSWEPTVNIVTTLPGQPVPTPDTIEANYPKATWLLNGRWAPLNGGRVWFGEANNQKPYQAMLMANPVVGERLHLTSQIQGFTDAGDAGDPWTFHYDYGTTSLGPWDRWPDCYRTAVLENSTGSVTGQTIINYVFARGIGQVDYWRGTLNADMTIKDGYRWYAVGWGGQ